MDTLDKLNVNTGTRETRSTESDYFQIVFIGIKDHYVLDAGGLDCTFELPDLFNACCDDWVGIFPVGWSTTSDKISFLKVNLPDNYQSGKACTCRLQFIGQALPADERDFYQFCYITTLGIVRGTSMPWQVCHPSSDDFVTEEDMDDDVMVICKRIDTLENESKRLHKENTLLGSQLKEILGENQMLKEQLVCVEKKLKQSSLEMCKVMLAESVKQAADDEMKKRNIATDNQQQVHTELKAQNSEAVENAEGTRDNRLNKNMAMIKDKFDRLQQSIQAAKNTAEDMRVRLAASQDRVPKVEAQCHDFSGMLEEVLLTLQQKDMLITTLQQEIVQTKGSFLSHQVEVAAAYEGPYMALKRACEQLKDRLNKEVNCNKTLTADNNELKKKLSSHSYTEASVLHEVEVHAAAAKCQKLLKEAEDSTAKDTSPAPAVSGQTKTWTEDQVDYLVARLHNGRLTHTGLGEVMKYAVKSESAVRNKAWRLLSQQKQAAAQDGKKK